MTTKYPELYWADLSEVRQHFRPSPVNAGRGKVDIFWRSKQDGKLYNTQGALNLLKEKEEELTNAPD